MDNREEAESGEICCTCPRCGEKITSPPSHICITLNPESRAKISFWSGHYTLSDSLVLLFFSIK